MRYARPSDAPGVAALLREAAVPGRSLAAEDEIDEAAVALDIAEGLGLRVVADRGAEVVGFLKVVPGELASLARTGQLQMAVRRHEQGKGIGAGLLRFAIDWANAGAVDRIELFVRESNIRAIELYRRFGFVEEGRLRGRVRLPDGKHVDDLVMARLFGEAAQGD